MMISSEIALQVESLTIEFGGLKAVSDLDLEIKKGLIFGIIGPNGAGKTTLFNMLTGVYRPTTGQIYTFGESIIGKAPYEITKRGVARTFQNIRLFKNLSVLENILIPLDENPKKKRFHLFSSIIQGPSFFKNEETNCEEAKRLLDIFQLTSRKDQLAKNLPYGDQRRLEIARAMATGAQLLLLDEPAAGLNAHETQALMSTIRLIRDQFKVSILLIEHDMKLVMGICEQIAVLDYGIKIAEGTPLEIQKNKRVIEAYLGKVKEDRRNEK